MNKSLKKILIIDDDPAIVDRIKNRLEKEGDAVISVNNGKEAASVAFSQHPDLILLDIILPGRHGVEIMNEIKKDRWGREVPIIILSNFPDYPGIDELIHEYDYEIIGKNPEDLEDLVEKIKEKLRDDAG